MHTIPFAEGIIDVPILANAAHWALFRIGFWIDIDGVPAVFVHDDQGHGFAGNEVGLRDRVVAMFGYVSLFEISMFDHSNAVTYTQWAGTHDGGHPAPTRVTETLSVLWRRGLQAAVSPASGRPTV